MWFTVNVPEEMCIYYQQNATKCVVYLQDPAPALSKSRTQKFHKLFKTVPENEYPVDCKYLSNVSSSFADELWRWCMN